MANLEDVLEEFDATEANLRRLVKIWAELSGLVPSGIVFGLPDSERRRYDELCRGFQAIADGLPAIDGYHIQALPVEINVIAQQRFDAQDLGELPAIMSVEEWIHQPGREIEEYRHRLDLARRRLVRDPLIRLVKEINALLVALTPRSARPRSDRGRGVERPRRCLCSG